MYIEPDFTPSISEFTFEKHLRRMNVLLIVLIFELALLSVLLIGAFN